PSLFFHRHLGNCVVSCSRHHRPRRPAQNRRLVSVEVRAPNKQHEGESMAASIDLPDLRTEYSPHAPGRVPAERSSLLGLLPGIALLAVVGYAGKFVEHFINTYGKAHHYVLPNIEYVLWAILFGILIANTVGLPRI